ncbi:RHS repeat-associated protein [Chryseobacterium rhizosphaerae]|uniref:RHS repeat-associated protein n=1 Tax=Chryseobacterium rhizosphaerae TaxID=395937 RepID=A0AAE4C3P7_9FLAO|nr:RHS repeat-associated core domain-containing protein [Chryseobacterium rhizosphaerae]MDR6525890.1 RHS repeat-associated protein [Chryseobacterium rhizosphaerae]
MKTKLPIRLRRKYLLILVFFASVFTFASFTKEDRQKVRAFKLQLMKKYVYHQNDSTTASSLSDHINHSTPLLNKISAAPSPTEGLSVQNKGFHEIVSARIEKPANVFESIEKQGIIGEFSDDESDDATDNFFTINLPEVKNQNVAAYLEYELFGLDSYQSVSRSINKNVAFGGDIIVPGNKWSAQKEEISLNSLHQGKNTILFTSSLNGIKYRVKNVKIVLEKNLNPQNGISTLLSEDHLYVKGSDSHWGSQAVNINGQIVESSRGEFETLVKLSDEDKKRGFVSVTSSVGTTQYPLSQSVPSFKIVNEARFVPFIVNVSKDSEYNEKYENATVSIEKNSVAESGQVEILKLRKKDYPSVYGEIKNLSVNAAAYRVNTRSGNFTKKVKLSFPYDEKKLGVRSAKEIKVFYFDYNSRKWIADPTSVVNAETKMVTVETKGDGDYINGIISVPESPQLGASNPTGISGLKAGDAAAARNFISPPGANQKGAANVAYPIVIPSGRRGMQPNINVSYDSNKSNGWMGEGWDISGLSAISIDTRWGAPSFDSATETELYSLNGETLVYDGNYLPHRHNDISETSTIFTTRKQKRDTLLVDNKKTFFLRRNHDFSKIERYGTTPKDYRWVVTNAGGGKIYYGGNESGVIENTVIKDSNGNIVHWGVWREQDVLKNYVEYEYENIKLQGLTAENENLNGGQYFHISKITYTKMDGQNLKYYTVEFEKESRITRQDISVTAKRGVKEVEPYKLSKIYVKYDDELIRTYTFSYKEGQFFKTLLRSVVHKDTSNDVAYNSLLTEQFDFEYFDDIKSTPNSSPVNFGGSVDINAGGGGDAFPILPNFLKPSKISANNTFEWGVNGRVPGVGLDFLLPGPTRAYGHVMASFNLGHSEAEAKKAQELMDFDGDGIPDLIYRKPSTGLFLRSGNLASGNISFGQERQINYLNSNFSLTKTKTQNIGYDAGINVFGIGFNFSQMWATSKSETSSFILDANSDGVMDVAQDGQVLFGRINPIDGKVEMTQYSDNTENMVIVADTMMQHNSPLEGTWQDISKNDVVKVWVASRDGYIRFEDNVQVENVPNAKAQYSVEIKNPAIPDKNGRIYLKEFTAGMPSEYISITGYNAYYSQIQALPPANIDHLGINDASKLYVKSGDKVFIRLHKNDNYSFKVMSNPTISYVGIPKPISIGLSQDGFRANNGAYSYNFLLNNHTKPISIDTPGNISITVPKITFPNSQDDITFKIIKTTASSTTGEVIYSKTYAKSNIPFDTVPLYPGVANVTSLSFSTNDVPATINFVVESDSHTTFRDVNWNRINVDYSPTSGNPQNYTAVAGYPSDVITEFNPVIDMQYLNLPSGVNTYKIGINKNIPSNPGLPTGSFYYIVKSNGAIATKRRIMSPMNSSGSIVELDMVNNNQIISGNSPAEFYTGDIFSAPIGGVTLNIQVYCKTKADYDFYKAYSALFQNNPFNIYYGTNTFIAAVNHTSINSSALENIGQFYHNWSQFLYNEYADVVPTGNTDGFMLNPATPSDNYGRLINLASMQEVNIPVNLNFPMCNNLATQDETAQCIAQQISNTGFYQNPANFGPKPVTVLNPTVYKQVTGPREDQVITYTEKWIGVGPEQYAMADSFKDNETASGFFNPQTANPDLPDNLLLQGNVDTKMFSINKKYYSKSRTNTLSGSLFNFGIQNASSVLVGDGNIALQDFMDMNGDGYPDVVYKDAMQITNSTGGHGGLRNPFVNAYISNTDSYSKSLSPQYSAAKFIQTGASSRNGEVRSNTNQYSYSPNVAMNSGIETSASWSAQASVNYDSKDSGESYWMDVNGDGLADRVTGGGSGNMKYYLNLGYGLDNGYSYKNAETFASGPVGSLGFNLGFDFGGMSGLAVSVSAAASAALGSSKTTFEDINADGLADILIVGSSNTYVKYNLGNRFSDPVELFRNGGGIDYNNEAKTYRGGVSVGAGYYYTFPIVWWPFPPIPLIYLKIGGQVTGNMGLSIAEVDKSFKDMNGDGFPDLVVSKDDGFVVNYSTIGRTNKLKNVINFKDKAPFSVFSLDYEFTKPTYNDPHGRLVMKEVRIVNPDIFSPTYLSPTNNKDIVKTFKYEDGRYDRREREFFGFGKVTSYDMWYSNSVYRSQIDFYHNKNYFLNGRLRKVETYTGTSDLNSTTEYEYNVYKFKNNNTKIDLSASVSETYDTGGKEGRKMAIALLGITRKKNIESGGNITVSEGLSYNDKGLVTQLMHFSNAATYNAVIDYHNNALPNNILNVPKSIKVYEALSTSNPIRERFTEVDPNTGLLLKVSVKLNASETAKTEFTYDSFGNVSTVLYPENENGDRYNLSYEYDSNTYKYVVNTKDVFGYISSADYDPKFDVVTQITDVSGSITEYKYDAKGRIAQILAPKEKEAGAPYTVKYSYNTFATPNPNLGYISNYYWCLTENYNPQDPSNPVETMTFSDGWGKVVQTKKDILLNGEEKMSVSGRTIYDVVGRAISQHHPIFENKYPPNDPNHTNVLLNMSAPSPYYSSVQRDTKDRVAVTVDELFHTANTMYSIENNMVKSTLVLFQNSNTQLKSETFTNSEGKTAQVNDYLNGQALTTKFVYNTIGELKSTEDPMGIKTLYLYDKGGRRIQVEHADRGINKYEYDPAGNTIKMYTSNMENTSPAQKYIHYKFDFNRLSDIQFPDLPGSNPSNVHYQYGAPGSGNNSGKLIFQSDNSGTTKFEYGNMGEVVMEHKTISGYGIPNMEFRTLFEYDSWNRIQNLTYADGEMVRYEYDLGGNLKRIYSKDGHEYVKKIVYDHYEQRTSIELGNGTKSEFEYTLADRKLNVHRLKDDFGTELLRNSYKYDYLGNITQLKNSAGIYNELGGSYAFNYKYDHLNRLASSDGSFTGDPQTQFGTTASDFEMTMGYNKAGGIKEKNQKHNQDGGVNDLNTYDNVYHYITGTHKVEVIENLNNGNYEKFEYDYNGNVVRYSKSGDDEQLLWDEQDRLKAVNKDNQGVFQYYVYDDKGERVIKCNLEQGAQLYQNGQIIDPGTIQVNSFKIYPNAYHVENSEKMLTKHYYAGSERVASRIMDFDFPTMRQANASDLGNKSKDQDNGTDLKLYLKKAGIDFNQVKVELAKGPQLQAGVYYLHGDHLGTATFVTNQNMKPTQFFLNLPFGETMAEQMTGVYNNPYKFNAKELDEETGLYYYGARYYNPRLSIWYGVDPMMEKFPAWNPYNYTLQNPIKYTDPDGRSPWDHHFDARGRFLYDDHNGSHNIIIHIGSQRVMPSQLDQSKGSTLALMRIAVHYASKNGMPGVFGAGPSPVGNLAADNPGYTIGASPYASRINTKGGLSDKMNDYFNFTNVLKHENFHKIDFLDGNKTEGKLYNHLDVYLNQMADPTFKKGTAPFQRASIGSFGNYLLQMNEDETNSGKLNSYIERFNQTNSGGYKIRVTQFNSNGIPSMEGISPNGGTFQLKRDKKDIKE